MAKKKFHIAVQLPVVLITISLCLLLVLQIFWLKDSYEKAYGDFSRETNYIFRSTMLAVRDSLFEKNIHPVADSASIELAKELLNDSINRKIGVAGLKYLQSDDKSDDVHVYISQLSDEDSLKQMMAPLASKMRKISSHRNFVIRFDPDTLSIDSISNIYKSALAKAEITAPFMIRRTHANTFYHHIGPFPPKSFEERTVERNLNPTADSLSTDLVHIGPLDQYYASFPGIRKLIISKISPQIFFSLFITIITTFSFVIIYRGMRAQQKLIEHKNEFINNVTHELRTPVATVSVAIEALQKFDVLDKPELTQEYLHIAKQELERLSQMTDSILKTSILENKGIEFIPERVNLDTIIQKMMSRLKLILEDRGASITYNKEGNDFEIQGSPIHLANLLHNLVDNALKYSPVNPTIHIALGQNDSRLYVSVRDNGIGIAKEFQEKVFEKFFRIPTGDIHNAKGYGLGLSYASSVVKSHKGTIEVSSELNHGSEFKVTFPRTK